MIYVVSKYNHKLKWLYDYANFANEVYIYDRSEFTKETGGENRYTDGHTILNVKNIGSDIYDKLTFIIDHYDNLPEVACYIKANLFDYIKPREFEKIKDSKVFTPILSQDHHTYSDDKGLVCYYKDGMYYERNNFWYLNAHPCKSNKSGGELATLLGINPYLNNEMMFVPFAPGSNYILPKETILKHPKEFYEKLRSYLDWAVYPGEAQIIERGLYNIWK